MRDTGALSARFALRVTLACLSTAGLCVAATHPVRVDENSNCLECHADHATGDHVHAAAKIGCTSCHTIDNREDATYIVFKQGEGVACFECHKPVRYQSSHFPYASGMCTRCHNPHVSANLHLLRAKVNELCLSCHLRTSASVESRYLPTIALTVNNSMGHPYERHPVSGSRDPLSGGEMSCICCHLAHGGTQLHHLKTASEIPEDALNQNTETGDMCRACHERLWGVDGTMSRKTKKKSN